MRVVVLGATGNAGTSTVRALSADPQVESIVGVARRLPELKIDKVEWRLGDIRTADLGTIFQGADAVVHLAWLIQPSRDLDTTRSVNVDGSARVFRTAAEAKVPAVVYASSVGAYSPGPKDRLVDEGWPTGGVQSSFYGRHKAEVERLLDDFEKEHTGTRVVRLRPGLIFKRGAASGIRRLFIGPLAPSPLLRAGLIPLVPDIPRLRFQAVHSADVGEAYRLAVTRDVRGAFNVAADPVLDPAELSRLLGARRVRLPAGAVRAAASATWRLRLQPTPPGWLDLALETPLMDITRAREELGWNPRHTSGQALLELLDGLSKSDGEATPPLAPGTGGPLRVREFLTGVGKKAA
ncbi:MAG TPA: NAD-dependent epimerase/dehydratase family protein [Thermoleophilaceae bacterium]|nr:NAD-dependent epimerase/dehydratase family protein [Thermoleophilaceae bacterium]